MTRLTKILAWSTFLATLATIVLLTELLTRPESVTRIVACNDDPATALYRCPPLTTEPVLAVLTDGAWVVASYDHRRGWIDATSRVGLTRPVVEWMPLPEAAL